MAIRAGSFGRRFRMILRTGRRDRTLKGAKHLLRLPTFLRQARPTTHLQRGLDRRRACVVLARHGLIHNNNNRNYRAARPQVLACSDGPRQGGKIKLLSQRQPQSRPMELRTLLVGRDDTIEFCA